MASSYWVCLALHVGIRPRGDAQIPCVPARNVPSQKTAVKKAALLRRYMLTQTKAGAIMVAQLGEVGEFPPRQMQEGMRAELTMKGTRSLLFSASFGQADGKEKIAKIWQAIHSLLFCLVKGSCIGVERQSWVLNALPISERLLVEYRCCSERKYSCFADVSMEIVWLGCCGFTPPSAAVCPRPK